jgi:hypothetical protein
MTGVRLLVACGLVCVAVFGPPILDSVAPAQVAEPSAEMKTKVADVAQAMKNASAGDRAIWASVWEKAAVVVEGDAVTTEVAFTDTRSLRKFTVIAMDIAWRRLGGNQQGKYPGLREATEKAMTAVVGLEVLPVTPAMRKAYAETCRAIAWAGVGRG